MFKLTIRVPSSIPLELDSITPDRIVDLSALEVAKLPVQHGNRRESLGDFFDGGSGVAAIVPVRLRILPE